MAKRSTDETRRILRQQMIDAYEPENKNEQTIKALYQQSGQGDKWTEYVTGKLGIADAGYGLDSYTQELNKALDQLRGATPGAGWQTGAAMDSYAAAIKQAQTAQSQALAALEKYSGSGGSGYSGYRDYYDRLGEQLGAMGTDAAAYKELYGQFTDVDDYNARYAWPTELTGLSDRQIKQQAQASAQAGRNAQGLAAEPFYPQIRAKAAEPFIPAAQMAGAAKADAAKAAALEDAKYKRWIDDYYANQTVLGIDEQIRQNQKRIDQLMTGKTSGQEKGQYYLDDAARYEQLMGMPDDERQRAMTERDKALVAAYDEGMGMDWSYEQYDSMGKKTLRQAEEAIGGLSLQRKAVDLSRRYDAMLQDPDYKRYIAKGMEVDTSGLAAGIQERGGDEHIGSLYTFLTPEDRDLALYTIGKEGMDAGHTMLQQVEEVFQARQAGKLSKDFQQLAQDYPLPAWAAARAINLLGVVTAPFKMLDAAFNPAHSKYSLLYADQVATSAVDQEIARQWGEGLRGAGEAVNALANDVGLWKAEFGDDLGQFLYDAGSWAYSTGTSGADMLLALATGKGVSKLLGGSLGVQKAAVQTIMSSQAANSQMYSAMERGLDPVQAVALGLGAAAIEWLTERYSLDALLRQPDVIKTYIAQNALVEASEEGASSVLNTVWDAVVSGDKSEYAMAYKAAYDAAYMANGGDAEAAKREASRVTLLNKLGEIGLEGLSGAVIGGGAAAIHTLPTAVSRQKTGRAISKAESYHDMMNMVEALPKEYKAVKVAQEVGAERTPDGKGWRAVSQAKMGRIWEALQQDLTQREMEVLREGQRNRIIQRLQELKADGDLVKIADAMQRAWMGEKLTGEHLSALTGSEAVDQVARELRSDGYKGSEEMLTVQAQKARARELLKKKATLAEEKAATEMLTEDAAAPYESAQEETDANTAAQVNGTAGEIVALEATEEGLKATVTMAEGEVQTAIDEVKVDSYNTAQVLQEAKREGAEGARKIWEAFSGTDKVNPREFVGAWRAAYEMGRMGTSASYAKTSLDTQALPEEIRLQAYEAGKADYVPEAMVQAQPSETGKVAYAEDIDRTKLTKGQSSAMSAMEILAKATGINVQFYRSKEGSDGTYNGYANGKWDPTTRTIHLDVNAGKNSSADKAAYAILSTASHELTHAIRTGSPEMYRRLQSFVVEHLIGAGVSIDMRIQAQRDIQAKLGKDLSYEDALEEVVAEACEHMLAESQAIKTLVKQDQGLAAHVKGWLRAFFGQVKQAFTGVDARSLESRALTRRDIDGVRHYVDGMQKLWDDALVDAAKNLKQGKAATKQTQPKQKARGETDTAYMSAVEKGDMEAARGLVEQAAREKGFTVKAYHGTGADFNIFSEDSIGGRNVWGKGFYFGASRYVADDYATWRSEGGGKYRIVNAMLKMQNPFIPDESTLDSAEGILDRWFPDMWQSARDLGIGYIEGKLKSSPLSLLGFIAEHNNIEIRDVLQEYGYDSIKDGGELVVFDPNQIKSAEPTTYDDAGAVIPLSERFNQESDDIRYQARGDLSDSPEFKRWFGDSKVADADGKPFAVYHATPAEFSAFRPKGGNHEYYYFSENRNYSERFARLWGYNNPKIVKAFLSIQNPLEMMGMRSPREWQKYLSERGVNLAEDGTTLLEEAYGKAVYGWQVFRDDTGAIRDAIKEAGYDGVKTTESSGDITWVALEPNQIKSAESVTFDDSGNAIPLSQRFSESDDIRYQPRDAEPQASEAMTTVASMYDTDGTMYHLRSMQEDYSTYKGWLKAAGMPDNEIAGLFDTIDAVMARVEEKRAILDFGEDIGREGRSFFPVKPNADPLYKVSLDFSSLCRKRLLQQIVQERLERKYKTVLTKQERVAIRNALIELRREGKNIEVACALCYVESARLKSPAQIDRFMRNKRAMLVDYLSKASKEYSRKIDAEVDRLTVALGYEKGTAMSKMSKADKKKVQAAKKAMYPKYTPTAAEEAMIRTAEALPEEMYKTADGLWQLKREYPVIFEAYTTFVRNATKSKGIEKDTPFYAGDTQSISDKLIAAMNRENGLRSQSWSDFQVIHMLDYIAAIIELHTRGAKMQSYTKVPEFVRLMGRTGVMINLSLIPNDYDGRTLTFDNIEGMDMAVAQELRTLYHDTVGTIAIGISDSHIRALLASDLIDYVIPYHKSSLDKKSRQAMGLKAWNDYEGSQSEKERDYANTDKDGKNYHKKPLFSEWYNHQEAVEIAKREGAAAAMREMADRYIELCHERGLQEKFAQFATEENYWKLLIDRKMIDQVTGELIEQKAVKPVFEKDTLLDILQGELDRFDAQNKDMEAAADEVERMWEKGEIRKAAKSKKVQESVTAFEDSVVIRNIVESAGDLQSEAKFSLRTPVEETKDMVAMHNMSEEAVLNWTKNGRLYWPSIAVVNKDRPFNSFGEYSMLWAAWNFGEEWDNPASAQEAERFRMYGTDAYTASLPQEVAEALNSGEETFRGRDNYTRYTEDWDIDDYIAESYGGRYSHGFPGSVRVNATKRYSNIYEMMADRARLRNDRLIHETMTLDRGLEKERRAIIRNLYDLSGGYEAGVDWSRFESDYHGFENDLLLKKLDDVRDGKYLETYGNRLDEIVEFAKGKGITLTSDVARDLLGLFERVANDAVGYFEIKYSRIIKGVIDTGAPQTLVAPDTLPDSVRKYCEDVGIGLYTYKAGDMEDRRRVVNEAAENDSLLFQARNDSFLSEREILAGADPDAFKSAGSRTYLKTYQGALRELERLTDKLTGYQEAALKEGISADERRKAEERVTIARNQVTRQEDKLTRLEAQPQFAQALDTERRSLEQMVREIEPDAMANEIRKYESRLQELKKVESAAGEVNRIARQLYKERNRWVNKSEVYALTKEILEENGSTLKAKDVAPRVQSVLEKIANAKSAADYRNASEDLGAISSDIVTSAKAIMPSVYEDMRDTLKGMTVRLTDVQKSEVKSSYGSMAEYRNALNGLVKISESGMDLTSKWLELSDMYPVFFPADASEGDMIYCIATAAEAMQPELYNPFAGNQAEGKKQISTDLLNRGMAIDVHLPAIERQKIRYEQRIEQLEDRIKKVKAEGAQKILEKNAKINEIKAENVRKLAAAYQQGRDRLERYKERTKDTQSRSTLRDRIRKDVKALNDLLLKETDVRHVPEELKGAVARFLMPFTQDTSVFRKAALDDLRHAYSRISDMAENKDGLPEVSFAYSRDMELLMDTLRSTIDGKRLSELDAQETELVRDIVAHMLHMVRQANRIFFGDKAHNFAMQGAKVIEETDAEKPYKGKDGPVANMLRNGMATPAYFFKRLGGVMQELFNDIKRGESLYGLRLAASRSHLESLKAQYNYDKWRNLKGDLLTFKTAQGHEITLTREQALGLYATWNRENSDNGQGSKHLEVGGFIYEKSMKKNANGRIEVDTSKPHRMTAEDMKKVNDWLTKEQKDYADAMVKYLSQDMGKLGNETSMMLFGIEKYGEEKYFPYQTSRSFRYTALGANAATNDQRLKHSGFTRRLTQAANNPIIAVDFTNVCEAHINHMLLYSSMCVPLENLNRIYNYRYTDENGQMHSVKQSLQNAYGNGAMRYIENLMTDINGGVVLRSDGLMERMIGKFKKNAVYASWSVVIQQPSAMVRAMALVNPKYFAPGISKGGKWDELRKHSGIAVIKEMGRFDTGTGLSAQDWLGGERRDTMLAKVSKTVDDAASWLPEHADRLAWQAIWGAVKAEVADATGLTGEALLQAAGRRFDEVVSYTQVYDSVLSKSQMMRNPHLNAVTAFMGEPTVAYNLLMDAITNRGKADSVNPARAVAAFMATAVVNAMLKSLVTAARDDEDKNYWEKYLGEMTENTLNDLNPFGLVPYARDIISIIQGYDVERPDMSLVADLYNGVRRGIEAIQKDGDWYKGIKELAGPISAFAGVPVKNVWRDIEAVGNVVRNIDMPLTAEGVKYSVLEALPGYDSKASAYYDRRLDAMLAGDAAELESLTTHLETGMAKEEKSIATETKKALGNRYKAGKVTDTQATDLLMDYFGMDEDDAYWQLKNWRETEANKDTEDYSFSRYNGLDEALASGNGQKIKAAQKELTDNGYASKTVYSETRSRIKKLYMDGKITWQKARQLLTSHGDQGTLDTNEWYWKEQEWKYDKANKGKDVPDWTKYRKLDAALETGGKAARDAIKELVSHGVDKGEISGKISERYKAEYAALYKTNRSAALSLQEKLLDMYVAAGYDREERIKHIKRNWLK